MNKNSYLTVLQEAESRYEEKKSVFLGFCKPVSSEADAATYINSIKKKYPDARHHVYAYALREGNMFRYTDDSEPSGTAGMPTLDAIRKRDLTDCVVVVVRYFGGTLLGTGGLVKAYSTAARDAITNAIPIRYDAFTTLAVTVDYSDYQKLMPSLKQYEQLGTEFNTRVVLTIRLHAEDTTPFIEMVQNTTSARANVDILKENIEYSTFYSE